METINSDATHPLSNLDEQITQASMRQGDYDFGAHFYGYGKGIVKGGNLSFYRRQEEGKEFVELEFKVNNYALPHLRQCATQNTKLHSDQPLTTEETNQLLEWIGDDDEFALHEGNPQEEKALLEKAIRPRAQCDFDRVFEGLHQQTLHFKGLGEARLVREPSCGSFPNFYRKVVIRVDEADLPRIQKILEKIGLQEVLTPNEKSDEERLKIGQLFRAFYPREALELERSEVFYKLSIPQLKQKIISLVPEMENIFQSYLPRMGKTETLPGKQRHTIPLSEGHKGVKLRHGLMGISSSFQTVENILQFGLMSREIRNQVGMNTHGIGPVNEATGSDDSVFVQGMTKDDDFKNENFYDSDIVLIVDKKILDTVTYQYSETSFGSRDPEGAYKDRPSIREYFSNPRDPGHEIMVKDRIPPEMIKKILVRDSAQKQELINHLVASKEKEEGITESSLNFYKASLEKMIVTKETFIEQRKATQVRAKL